MWYLGFVYTLLLLMSSPGTCPRVDFLILLPYPEEVGEQWG